MGTIVLSLARRHRSVSDIFISGLACSLPALWDWQRAIHHIAPNGPHYLDMESRLSDIERGPPDDNSLGIRSEIRCISDPRAARNREYDGAGLLELITTGTSLRRTSMAFLLRTC